MAQGQSMGTRLRMPILLGEDGPVWPSKVFWLTGPDGEDCLSPTEWNEVGEFRSQGPSSPLQNRADCNKEQTSPSPCHKKSDKFTDVKSDLCRIYGCG